MHQNGWQLWTELPPFLNELMPWSSILCLKSMGDSKTAIEALETKNKDLEALEFSITSISWLNGDEVRQAMGHSPLMVYFKSKEAANTAIEQSLAVNGIMCMVSIYVLRSPQCFQCQDWGHQVTECAGPHVTREHMCTHDNPCPTGQCCATDKPKCTNCDGDHFRWI